VDQFAGRGVGLDVVREAVERLGAEIDVRTQRGLGSCFELLVPVSLVSVEALIVEAGGQLAAVPIEGVRGTLRVAPADVVRGAQGPAIAHEGRLIALLSLDALIGAASPRRALRALSAFVVEGDASAAVAVDRFVGIESLWLRPLPELAPASAVVAGVYVDDEGHPRPVLDAQALARQASRPAVDEALAPAAPRPILVVDDSLTTRMLERSILESAGYEVQLATSGEEALDMARRNDYALMLVDVEMPGMDGFDFIERTRTDPALRDVPCVLVTSREAPHDRQRGEAAGASAYIVKSEFDQARFLDRVAALVGAGG
jgi:two-component system chemotaxis sensor kinase CheA